MMTELEMEGFLRGKCVPGDMLVNETRAQYLVRKFKALEEQRDALAAETAALKSKGRELLNEACGVYEKYNATINPENGDFMDGQTLHEFQFLMDVETPATDAFLRGVRASAVDAACLKISKAIASCRQDEMIGLDEAVNIASDFATELRKGGAA